MTRLPDLEAWAILAKVVEAGSFAKAADALGLSKPTVSKAITRLEQRLRIPLLHRTSRKLTLTESGRAVLGRAQAILDEGLAAEVEAMAQADLPVGRVRVTAPMSFGLQQLGALLPEFMLTYPEVIIDLHLSDAQVDVIGGGFDLAIRIAALEDSTLRARRVCAIRRLIVASPGYLDRNGRPAHPNDLQALDAILYSNLQPADVWQLGHPKHASVSVKVRGRLIADNADVVVPSLVAGLGIAVQPEFTIEQQLASGELEVVLPDWSLPPIGLFLVTPPSALRPSRVQVLIDFLARRLANAGWASQ